MVYVYKYLNMNSLRLIIIGWKKAEKCALRSKEENPNNCGVLSAISRVFTIGFAKAIREQLLPILLYSANTFCMVHDRRDRKAVLCRP